MNKEILSDELIAAIAANEFEKWKVNKNFNPDLEKAFKKIWVIAQTKGYKMAMLNNVKS